MRPDDWRGRLEELLAEFSRRRRDTAARAKVDGVKPDRIEAARAWHAELVDHGLAAPGWPTAVGGLGLTVEDQLDYYRITTAAGAPAHPCPLSFILAPTLIQHGTSAQRDRFLRPLLRADEFWCQGFSEPGAGSDLASLSTRAVRDGDRYRVTGQKVWTTMADRADWMFALVRTGPPGRGTEGITYLLIPMDSAGITIRPLRDISGGAHFAEVFLEDVTVPVENVVGTEGGGWAIMRTSLGHERATAFLADEFKYRRTVDQVIEFVGAQELDSDPLVRQEVARLESGVRSIAANSARALAAVRRGEDPGGVASVNRLVKSEFEQQLHALALRAAGPDAALGSRASGAADGGRWTYGYLMSRATTIGAGTAEIQRNTIAESVLGLPSHRGEKTRPATITPGDPLTVVEGDERELRAVLTKALDAVVDVDALLDRKRSYDSGDRQVWTTLTEFGLPGLAVDESLGGSNAERRLLCAAIEQTGRALAPAPVVATVTALHLAIGLGTPAALSIASRIAGGEPAAVVVPRDDSGWVTTGALLPRWDSATVSGSVPLVAGAPDAAVLLVLVCNSAGTTALLAIDADADGVRVDAQEPLDLTTTIGTVHFCGAVAEPLGDGGSLDRALESARRDALLALAADSVGVGSAALAMAVAWAGERAQFGRPIGSFQAISHRCADMAVALEGARSQVMAAAGIDSSGRDHDVAVDLAAAASFDAAVAAAEGAIQIHGGIGFTWEHPAHLLLRRARSNAVLMARPDELRDRAARTILGQRDCGLTNPSRRAP